MPEDPKTSNDESAKPEKKPWPMAYVIAAIALFILLFNLYTWLTAE
ncbi:hypothetical protein [Cerasicoccus fimbriatus]|nr:hypothetical protein [Cerasicoccus sp. TK19100]